MSESLNMLFHGQAPDKRLVIEFVGGPRDAHTYDSEVDTEELLEAIPRKKLEWLCVFNKRVGDLVDYSLTFREPLPDGTWKTERFEHLYEVQQRNESKERINIVLVYRGLKHPLSLEDEVAALLNAGYNVRFLMHPELGRAVEVSKGDVSTCTNWHPGERNIRKAVAHLADKFLPPLA